jgi:hypothetical protein
MECQQLFNDFYGQFKKQKDAGSTVYARFKCGVVAESSFEDKFSAFAKIGWRSGTAVKQMEVEQKSDIILHIAEKQAVSSDQPQSKKRKKH